MNKSLFKNFEFLLIIVANEFQEDLNLFSNKLNEFQFVLDILFLIIYVCLKTAFYNH
jgi:hypothetical protein